MKILITGGAGFIGKNLSLRLVNSGNSVVIYDNFSTQIHGSNGLEKLLEEFGGICEIVKGDIRDRDLLRNSLIGCQAVVHLAAETGTGQSMYEIDRYVDVNSRGTGILLDILANDIKTISKIVVASSRSIYGEGLYICKKHGNVYPRQRSKFDLDNGDFEVKCPFCKKNIKVVATPEDSLLHPSSIYGITKLNQEQLTLVASESMGISGVALRFQNVYGPGQSLKNPYTGILSIFSQLLRLDANLNIFEDGKESRDFVYIDDVVDSLVAALFTKSKIPMVCNVGSGKQTTILEVARHLKEIYKSKSEVQISGNYRIGDIRHNFADLNFSKDNLGFEPQVKFYDGILSFTNWVLSQGSSASNIDAYEKSLFEMKSKGLLK